MVKTQAKRRIDIKSKLMAAICMLLVSAIMMVSSTYAWFTLSTAPEVKGITTAVGANGNLEMALMPISGDMEDITSGTSDSLDISGKDVTQANITWGNLVDLSSGYGLSEIVLNPSALLVGSDGTLDAKLLQTPVYGADGRVAGMNTTGTMSGTWQNDRAFYELIQSAVNGIGDPNAQSYGVRAVGTASGLTERQQAYRSALSAATKGGSNATRAAAQSLNAYGPQLADLAMKHATAGGTDTYDDNDLNVMLNAMYALVGTAGSETTPAVTGALQYIEEALKQYILANSLAKATDEQLVAVKAVVENTELANLINGGSKSVTVDGVTHTATIVVPENLSEIYRKLGDSTSNVSGAISGLNGLKADTTKNGSYVWGDFSQYLYKILNVDKMQLNSFAISDLMKDYYVDNGEEVTGTAEEGRETEKKNLNALASSVFAGQGLSLVLATEAGVYADIADFAGDYSASVTIDVIYGDLISVPDVAATMSTQTRINPVYLTQVANTFTDSTYEGGSGSVNGVPMTDYYGYVIDLAFRTNVADSYLKLQTSAVDRIYEGNESNPNTMGGGSYMRFKSDSGTFTSTDVVDLMKHIRVVFFDPKSLTIFGYAMLDTSATGTVTGNDGAVTCDLIMCTKGENNTYVAKAGEDAAKIINLEKDVATAVSVLVYLDGNTITNADVANAVSSMTGSMNIQFSSSAELVPMEYSQLKTNEGVDSGEDTPVISTTSLTAVTGPDGYTVANATYESSTKTIGFTLSDNSGAPITSGTVSVSVGGTQYTAAHVSNGGWTVSNVTDAVAGTTPIIITYTPQT